MNHVHTVQGKMVSGNQQKSQLPDDPGHSVQELWNACLGLVESQVTAQTFQTWFVPIAAVSLHEQTLLLRVPSRFFCEWVESHFGAMLKKAIREVCGPEATLSFHIAPGNSPRPGSAAARPDEEADPFDEDLYPAPDAAMIPSSDEQVYQNLDQRFSLETFIPGAAHKFALRAAARVAEVPGVDGFSPLVFYGGNGCGKSHLLQGIGNYLQQHHRSKRIACLSSERFLHDYVQALQNGGIQRFIHRMIAVDVLLIEDIQFLAGKSKSQETLAFIFAELVKKGGQIVLTCNQAPSLLPRFSEGLVALFHQGLLVDLPGADYTAREGVIRQYLQKNKLSLEEKVIHFLADHLGGNLHLLHSVMVRLIAQMSLLDKQLQLDDVRYIVSRMCPQADMDANFSLSRRELRVDEIVKAVADFYQLPVDVVQGVSRKKKIVQVRQMAIYLCRELTAESLNTIGYHFSNLHHASVLYAYNKVVKDLEANPSLRSAIPKIKALLFN